MAEVNLKPEIYLSYASGDDAAPPFEEKTAGFVTFLHEQLSWELNNLGEARNLIWFDRARVNPAFTPNIKEAIFASEVFLVVLSPNWLANRWCLEELTLFAGRWQSDEIRRFVPVIKSPVDREDLPPPLRHREGYSFYARGDADAVSVQEFYWRGLRDKERYFEVLARLANDLVDLLRHVRQPIVSRPKREQPEEANFLRTALNTQRKKRGVELEEQLVAHHGAAGGEGEGVEAGLAADRRRKLGTRNASAPSLSNQHNPYRLPPRPLANPKPLVRIAQSQNTGFIVLLLNIDYHPEISR
jgi:hypothetical protein